MTIFCDWRKGNIRFVVCEEFILLDKFENNKKTLASFFFFGIVDEIEKDR